MGKDPRQWDDIPSLDDLEIDWNYTSAGANGNRSHKRMSRKELTSLFGTANIPVRAVTEKECNVGTLLDICEGGLAIILDAELTKNQMIKIGLFLGRKEIISHAIVRHVDHNNKPCRIGMQFEHLSRENTEYLAGMYRAKTLDHARPGL